MSDILLQGAVIAATLAVIIVSALANYLPINGQTTRDISDRIRVYCHLSGAHRLYSFPGPACKPGQPGTAVYRPVLLACQRGQYCLDAALAL
jgi:hypothetical protein